LVEYLMIVVGGLLGSSHCVGMCGGFVLALGARSQSVAANIFRQVAYALGRVFTYSVGGLAAGYGGWRLVHGTETVVNLQAVLSIVAGILLVLQGLLATRVLVWPVRRAKAPACLAPQLFGSLLRANRLTSVFLGGIVNGLLPCGLVYAYLSLAAATGTMQGGGLVMALFGLGTLPVMVFVGASGSLLSANGRRHLLTFAAWCVVLTGVLCLLRGFQCLTDTSPDALPACPFCSSNL